MLHLTVAWLLRIVNASHGWLLVGVGPLGLPVEVARQLREILATFVAFPLVKL
jgi:hypothetical protein